MLTFVGLGLYDKKDISQKGLERVRRADFVFLECYTSTLAGSTIRELEEFYGRKVQPLYRDDVERYPDEMLCLAAVQDVVFLCAGDPMVSTTHADLRMRAGSRGIGTAIIHAASIASAACGLSGLQNYRFGKSCSVPFPQKNWAPTTSFDVIAQNLSQRLHTLVYLDIRAGRYMTVNEAVGIIESIAAPRGATVSLYVGIARAGSDSPVVRAGTAETIRSFDFGPPLHVLIIPAELHDMERAYLEMFAGL